MSHERLHWGFNEVETPNPYWGQWTSTINWCEQDYAVTKYMAEFINTITNAWVLLIIVTLYGVYHNGLPKRYWVIFTGISCVGIGSWWFHMTLLWEWQVLGDELPMIIAATCLLFMVLDTSPADAPAAVQNRKLILSASMCVGIVVFVSAVYIYTGFAVFHQVSFALIMFVGGGRVLYLLKTKIKKYDPDFRIRRKRAQIVKIFITGALFFLLGFGMWNADNLLCHHLTNIKRSVGMPFSFIFELHGWWHLLTGYGTILMSHAAMLLVLIIREGPRKYDMKMWGGWLPIVKKVSRDVTLNGSPLLESEEMYTCDAQ